MRDPTDPNPEIVAWSRPEVDISRKNGSNRSMVRGTHRGFLPCISSFHQPLFNHETTLFGSDCLILGKYAREIVVEHPGH